MVLCSTFANVANISAEMFHKVSLGPRGDGQGLNLVNVLFFVDGFVVPAVPTTQQAVGIVNHESSRFSTLFANECGENVDYGLVIFVRVLVHNANIKENERFAVWGNVN